MITPALVQALRERQQALERHVECQGWVMRILAGVSPEEQERLFACVRDAAERKIVPERAAKSVYSALDWLYMAGCLVVKGPVWAYKDRPAGCGGEWLDGGGFPESESDQDTDPSVASSENLQLALPPAADTLGSDPSLPESQKDSESGVSVDTPETVTYLDPSLLEASVESLPPDRPDRLLEVELESETPEGGTSEDPERWALRMRARPTFASLLKRTLW